MTLRELQYLIVLNRTRHFGQAAEACFVTQPTLSTQIRKLEEELGVQLFERDQRHVLPTQIGELVVRRAVRIMHEVEQIRETARSASAPESGSLKLGVFPTLAPYLLPHVVPVIRRQFPQLQLLLVEEKTDILLAQLEAGALDCAILAEPVDEPSLQSIHLFEEPFVVALPDSDPLASQSRIRMSDLATRELLLLEEGHCLRQQALDVCTLAQTSERPDFRATSLETLRQMVVAEVGITLLPLLSVQPPVSPQAGLTLRPFAGKAPSRRLSFYWRSTVARSEFLAAIAELIRQLPKQLLTPPD